MTPTLFIPIRVCCVCEVEATGYKREPQAREPNIIAISATIYRRGKGKGTLTGVRRVQICENCLLKALTQGRLSWIRNGGSKLWDALRASLLDRYSDLIEADKA